MAELTQNPISFPWELFQAAQAARNANQRLMYQDIEGIGKGFGQIGQDIEQQGAKSIVAQAIEALRNGKMPMKGPQLPGVGLTQGQPMPTSGMGAPTPPTQLPPGLSKALMTLDPKFGTNQFDELRNSEVFKNYAAGQKDLQGNPKSTYQLRNDYINLTKEFATTSKAYQRVIDSSTNPSAAGDVSLIYAFMRMQDPSSTVREGEFATAQNAGSIPERVRGAYNKAINGERLSNDIRSDFVSRAKSIYEGQKRFNDPIAKQFSEMATREGQNPLDVVVDFNSGINGVPSTPSSLGSKMPKKSPRLSVSGFTVTP